MLLVCLFDLCLLGFVGFLFLWGLGRAAFCDCGTPWTFLLPFFDRSWKQFPKEKNFVCNIKPFFNGKIFHNISLILPSLLGVNMDAIYLFYFTSQTIVVSWWKMC